MIPVTRLNGKTMYLNAELIEAIEATPDTMITLHTGKKLMVSESIDDVVGRVIKYRQKINLPDDHGQGIEV